MLRFDLFQLTFLLTIFAKDCGGFDHPLNAYIEA